MIFILPSFPLFFLPTPTFRFVCRPLEMIGEAFQGFLLLLEPTAILASVRLNTLAHG
jgi:hypothetical protein